MAGEELHHLFGVGHVAVHAQRERFDALQDQPGAVGREAGAEIAQAFAARAQQEGADRAFFAEHHVVKAFVGLGQLGEFARFFPVETAAVDQHAADHGAVAAQELGGRVVNDVGTKVEGLDQVRRGEGGVHQQRHFGLVGDLRHGGNVEHVQPRVAHGFAEEQLGVGAHGVAPAVDVARLHEGGLDAEAAQGVVQQVLAAAVERGGGHDV